MVRVKLKIVNVTGKFAGQRASDGRPQPVTLVLGSVSPRRRALLKALGLTFEVVPADVDETPKPNETPQALVRRLSEAKADAVAALLRASHPDALLIAADTVVTVDGETLGKPVDESQNRAFIEKLSGRAHEVHTGHTLKRGEARVTEVVSSTVVFRALDRREIDWYVSTGEGLDKAGGYAIQGFGAALVWEVHGSYFSVVGLSVAHLVEMSKRLGVPLV